MLEAPHPTNPLTSRQRALFSQLLASFLEHGFAHFTAERAAKDFHCSKSTLYALGASRDEIVERVIRSFFREVARRTNAALESQRNPAAKLDAYFRAIALAMEPASTSFMQDLRREPLAREIYSANTLAATKIIGELIQEGTTTGEFHTPNPQFVALWTQHTLEDIQVGRYAETCKAHEAYRMLGNAILQSLAHGSTATTLKRG